jgi:hypothetical protein
MGVALEATVELYLFEYRLKISSGLLRIFDLHKISSPSEFFYQVRDDTSILHHYSIS